MTDLVLLPDYLANGWERCNAHQQGLDCVRHRTHRTVDGAAIGPAQPTHGDPYLSPWQTNPTATPWDGVEGRDLTFGRGEDGEGEA